MSKYIHLFKTKAEFRDAYLNHYEEPWLSCTEDTGKVSFNKRRPTLKDPFTIEFYGDGVISWNIGNRTVLCSKNKGEWQSMTGNLQITVANGDTLEFLGDNENYSGCSINTGVKYVVFGNINSLISSDNFENIEALTSENTFQELFKLSRIVSAEYLILPATTLSSYCYDGMFNKCTDLVTAPALPATTLAASCYHNMFQGCTNLGMAPELPATELAAECYSYMFQGCKSFVTAPELIATTLAFKCYNSMFAGCTSLTTAPELPATTLTKYCYQGMFNNCLNLVTAPELPATTLEYNCYKDMFNGCRNLTAAPELPAITLVLGCYNGMFSSCKKLSYIKAMFTTTPTSSYTQRWVAEIKDSGTFVKNSAATWNVTGNNGVPAGWTVETADA